MAREILKELGKSFSKSGNLKINGYGSLQKILQLYILFTEERLYFLSFSWNSLSPSPSSLGATLKGKNLLP